MTTGPFAKWNNLRGRLFVFLLMLCPFISRGQDSLANKPDDLFDLSLEELLEISVVELDRKLKLYGYINTNAEQQYGFPSVANDGTTLKEDDPFAWVPVKAFHLYGSAYLSERIEVLFNLAYADETIEVRNAWGNFKLRSEFQVRVGKMYRRFGLYNEKLDQIPTFIGIEPPEIFDGDHLFVTRTTSLMLHGNFTKRATTFSYALTTENGEGGEKKGVVPLGWDLRMKMTGALLLWEHPDSKAPLIKKKLLRLSPLEMDRQKAEYYHGWMVIIFFLPESFWKNRSGA
jgi:hypothetical protein